MRSVWTHLCGILALASSVYADCSQSLSGTFQLAAYDAVAETTTSLYLVNFLTVPETAFHVLSVCRIAY
jgi:hypothetical protein